MEFWIKLQEEFSFNGAASESRGETLKVSDAQKAAAIASMEPRVRVAVRQKLMNIISKMVAAFNGAASESRGETYEPKEVGAKASPDSFNGAASESRGETLFMAGIVNARKLQWSRE